MVTSSQDPLIFVNSLETWSRSKIFVKIRLTKRGRRCKSSRVQNSLPRKKCVDVSRMAIQNQGLNSLLRLLFSPINGSTPVKCHHRGQKQCHTSTIHGNQSPSSRIQEWHLPQSSKRQKWERYQKLAPPTFKQEQITCKCYKNKDLDCFYKCTFEGC